MLLIFGLAALCLAGCKSKSETEENTGAGVFLGKGESAPHADFVPVTEPEQASQEAQKSDGAEQSLGDGATDETGRVETDEEQAESEVQGEEPSPNPGSIGTSSVGTAGASPSPSPKKKPARSHVGGRGAGKSDAPTLGIDESILDSFGPPPREGPAPYEQARRRRQRPRDDGGENVIEVFSGSSDFGEETQSIRPSSPHGPRSERVAPDPEPVEPSPEPTPSTAESESSAEQQQPRPAASPTSTFSIDVDTGSYTLTGRKLARGRIPQPDEIRVEEFINFFDYSYPNPETAFGVTVEGSPSPFSKRPRHYLVRFGVQAQRLKAEDRKTQHLTVLVDSSASMVDVNALPVVKKSLRLLLDGLEKTDSMSIVSYADDPGFAASNISVAEHDKLVGAINQLEPSGQTGLAEGLRAAYRHALEASGPKTNSRILLFSDGEANIGDDRARELVESISEFDGSGIGLTVLGVGTETYNDALLEQLADRGDGTYHHVNAMPEAQRLFGDELESTLYTVAEDAKIQVAFDEKNVVSYRRIGYDNRALPDEFFRRDDVDAGEVGAGQSVTALYEIELAPVARGPLGTLSVRYNVPGGESGRELTASFSTDTMNDSFSKSSVHHRFAAVLAGFAEVLKQTALGKSLDMSALIEVAEGATQGEKEREAVVYLMRRLIELAE